MNKKFKIALVVLLAVAAVSTPFMHRHWKRFHSTQYAPENLPNEKDVNLFTLGKITDQVNVKGIKALSENESLVLFKFTTEDGEDVSLLMRRSMYQGRHKHTLKLDADDDIATHLGEQHVTKAKDKVKKFIGNAKEVPITAWYRLNEESGEWHQLFTVLDRPGHYRFAPEFHVRIFPNGLAAFYAEGQKPVAISATGAPAQISGDGTKIGIGKNKEISGSDLVKDFGNVHVPHVDSDEIP